MSRDAGQIHEETTAEEMSPELTVRDAVVKRSESWVWFMYLDRISVMQHMSNANAAPIPTI